MSTAMIAPMLGIMQMTQAELTKVSGDTSALLSRRTMRFRIFTESGEWECPAPDTPVFVLAIGGGGGGVYFGSNLSSTPGGESRFGTLATAAGGASVRANAGGNSNDAFLPGEPGPFGFGNGGSGVASVSLGNPTARGRKGKTATFFGTVSDDQPVIVGLGALSVGAGEGYGGGNGAVFVFWWEAA